MADPGILNWRRYDAMLTTSGQLDATHLAALAAAGVRTIVDLAPHTHPRALPDEAAIVAALGLAYVHIPVDFEAPAEADLAAFERAMATAQAPVHVHCIVNARVSAFLYRIRREKIGDAAARAELDRTWRPGGAWADFIGTADRDLPHRYAGRDY